MERSLIVNENLSSALKPPLVFYIYSNKQFKVLLKA